MATVELDNRIRLLNRRQKEEQRTAVADKVEKKERSKVVSKV